MAEAEALDILKQAILLEKRGRAFYSKVAQEAQNESVKEFFSLMAAEEQEHIRILADQYRSYTQKGTFSRDLFTSEAATQFANRVLDKALKSQIAAAQFEAAAISAAMLMEEHAIELYAQRARVAPSEAEQQLYNWLAQWERGHLSFLADIDREIRADIWNDNNFWPF